MSAISVRSFLIDEDAEKFDRLLRVLADFQQREFQERLNEQVENGDVLPAYAVFLVDETKFNLTALRALYRGLYESDRLEMALSVIEVIAERSGASADHRALRNVEVDVLTSEVDRYTPRKVRRSDPALFVVSTDQAEEWTEWLRENYSPQIGEWFYTKGQSARDIMQQGWVFEEFEPVLLTPGTDWIRNAHHDRTWAFTLHSWEFFDPVMREYLDTGDQALLEWAIDIAISWSRQALSQEAAGSMMWYDMALALRSPRLAGLLHAGAEAGFEPDTLVPLFELVLAHADAHQASESFVSRNNHGFYAALGQIILSRDLRCLPEMWRLRLQGEARMKLMAEQQFLSDGGHVEHSPDYHRMLLSSFQKAVTQGVITNPKVVARIEKASEALGWFVLPNGKILQLGDSPGRNMVAKKSKALTPSTKFISTDGREGRPITQELFALPATGYAVIRTPQPQAPGELGDSSYLAFAAGFHSRAHKHCDDLSIVWTHKGQEVLVDGGRYGYGPQLPLESPLRREGFYYAGEERQYVESVRAHNTISVDGKEHDRRRRPYGSGLISAEHQEGVFTISGEVPHGGWNHRREIRLNPATGLTIIDDVSTEDEEEHTYSLYFLLPNELEAAQQSSDSVNVENGTDLSLDIVWDDVGSHISIVEEQRSPLRGWRSVVDRELVPACSIVREGSFVKRKRIITVFSTD